MDKKDTFFIDNRNLFYILVFSMLFGIFTYFVIKLFIRYKRNNATWRQIISGYPIGHGCNNNGECVSNKCLQNICMV